MAVPVLVPQTDAGDAAGANSYVTLVEFKTYCDNHGYDYSAFTDDMINAALIRATQYLDSRFNFRGITLLAAQTTMWPRQSGSNCTFSYWDGYVIFGSTNATILLVDRNGRDIVGIPPAVKAATHEYGFRALTIPLFQDAPAPEGGRLLAQETVKVDVIERSVTYQPGQSGGFAMPAFPAADMMLAMAGLIEVGRTLFR